MASLCARGAWCTSLAGTLGSHRMREPPVEAEMRVCTRSSQVTDLVRVKGEGWG